MVSIGTGSTAGVCLGNPTVDGAPTVIVVGDHLVGIDGAVAVSAVVVDPPGAMPMPGLGILRQEGEGEKSGEDS